MIQFHSPQWNMHVTQRQQFVYCCNAAWCWYKAWCFKAQTLHLECSSVPLRCVSELSCQTEWSRRVIRCSASDRWLWDFSGPERDRWPTPNCLHADGGNADLYLLRTVVRHASLLIDRPAVPLRSVSRLHVPVYVVCHFSCLTSVLCLPCAEHRKCANKANQHCCY